MRFFIIFVTFLIKKRISIINHNANIMTNLKINKNNISYYRTYGNPNKEGGIMLYVNDELIDTYKTHEEVICVVKKMGLIKMPMYMKNDMDNFN